MDAKNHLRPLELPQQLSVLAVEPFVLLNQRLARVGLPAAMRRRQGLRRGHVALLSPCRRRRKGSPPRRSRALSAPDAVAWSASRRLRTYHWPRNDVGASSPARQAAAALRPASSAAAVVGGTPVVPSPPSVPPITATRSPIILSSPSAGLLGLYSHGHKTGVSPIIGTEGTACNASHRDKHTINTLLQPSSTACYATAFPRRRPITFSFDIPFR